MALSGTSLHFTLCFQCRSDLCQGCLKTENLHVRSIGLLAEEPCIIKQTFRVSLRLHHNRSDACRGCSCDSIRYRFGWFSLRLSYGISAATVFGQSKDCNGKSLQARNRSLELLERRSFGSSTAFLFSSSDLRFSRRRAGCREPIDYSQSLLDVFQT